MSKLIIGNQLTEETVEGDNALPDDYKQMLGRVAHRLIWLAGEGDVIVLPSPPDKDFAEQVWRSLGIADRPPVVLVPPPGNQGTTLLFDDRYQDTGFLATLKNLVAEHNIDHVLPFYFDRGVVELARAVGLERAAPGFAFLAEGGNEIVNTKSFFRMLAAGNGAAIAPGVVVRTIEEAEPFIWSMLTEGKSVIAKQDVHGGGFGNEIFTTTEGLNGIGANETMVFADRVEMAEYLAKAWLRYTQEGRHRVVLEHYIHDSVPIYIEIDVTEEGVTTVGFGEMRMKPINNGIVVPSPSTTLPSFPSFLAGASRIGEAVRAIGYRGRMSVDAIVTPKGEILFNEFNGRVGGSTHVHLIGERLVGPGYLQERVLIGRNRCTWSSVAEALQAIEEHGLAFDPVTRTGVLIAGDDGQCVLVGDTYEHVLALETVLLKALHLEDA